MSSHLIKLHSIWQILYNVTDSVEEFHQLLQLNDECSKECEIIKSGDTEINIENCMKEASACPITEMHAHIPRLLN